MHAAVNAIDFLVPFAEPRLPRPDPTREHPISGNFAKANVTKVESSLPAFDARIDALDKRLTARIRVYTAGGAVGLIALLITIAAIMWQATAEMRAVATREQEIVERYELQRDQLADSVTGFYRRLRTLEQAVCTQTRVADTTKRLPPEVAALLCR